MKLIKSSALQAARSEYGDFTLVPAEGFKLRTYIDFASQLLIVEEEPIVVPPAGFYTPKQYIVDQKEQRILEQHEYANYFDYSPQVTISDDEKYRLESQRKHDTQTGRDYFAYTLIAIESGKVITTGKGIATSKTKIKTALERHYQDLERRRQNQERIAKQKTLDEHYAYCQEQLQEGQFILGYYDTNKTYKLIYKQAKFVLYAGGPRKNARLPSDFTLLKTYAKLEDFWAELSATENWFLDYKSFITEHIPHGTDRLIAYFVLQAANAIRKERNLSHKEHEQLRSWEFQVFSKKIRRTEYHQYCSNCKRRVPFQARYPKYICGACHKQITDAAGRGVAYYNTHALGYGCQGYYSGTDPKEKYDSDICYINGIAFRAEEARFGGIVVQMKD